MLVVEVVVQIMLLKLEVLVALVVVGKAIHQVILDQQELLIRAAVAAAVKEMLLDLTAAMEDQVS
jgi:hypothetical protein